MPDTAMWAWVRSLHIPWIDSTLAPHRRGMAKGFADVLQHVVDDTGAALRELWPSTCSEAMLVVWGEVLDRPRRTGETVAAWRRRLATWRAENVGTSGWVLSEVTRITGEDPAPVLEFPRQSGRWGYGRWGTGRWGTGPLLVVGVDPSMRTEVAASLEEGVDPHTGIVYLAPDVFNAVLRNNESPVAHGGASQWALWGTTVTLDASASSDADGQPLRFSWRQQGGTTVTLTDADTAMPTYTAPNLDEKMAFEVTVTDTHGASDTDGTVVEIGIRASAFTAPAGRTTIFVASFTKGSNARDGDAFFRDPDNTGFGEMDLAIGERRDGTQVIDDGTNMTTITRVALRTANNQFGMNDHPLNPNLANIVGANGQMHVIIDASTSFTLTTIDSSGGDWIYWEVTDAQETMLSNIPVGRSFVVAVTQPTPP